MSIYDNNKELLSTLGVEGNYSTDFEVRKAILNALGGDASICNSIYEVDLQILKIYQEGGGGTGGGSTRKPVFKIKDEASLRTNETEIPFDIDSTEVTNFSYMFSSCTNLTTFPQLDTSKGTNFYSMFNSCTNLTTSPQLDTSNGTNFQSMFSDCINLSTIPQLDTSNGTRFIGMFYNCYINLTTIPQLDTSNGTSFSNMFGSCSKLENITFVGSINANIDFSYSTLLTYKSIKSILTACSNTTKTTSKTLKFNRTLTDQNGELAALVATCNTKGWTISGLTLE